MDTLSPVELSESGSGAYQAGKYAEAAEYFGAAAQAYTAQGDALNAAEMHNNQSVALLQAGDAQQALVSAKGTESTFEAAGDVRLQAMAIGNVAAALDALGKFEAAEAAYQRSADLLSQIGEDKLRANVMQSLSQLQLRTGRQLEALATMQSGVDHIKRPSLRQRLLKKLLKTPFKLLDR